MPPAPRRRRSPLALNREGVPGPRGGAWGSSTIHGNPARGTGILNNELYIGRLVWNRLRYIKDPATGKRVSRANPADGLDHQRGPGAAHRRRQPLGAVKARQGAAACPAARTAAWRSAGPSARATCSRGC